MALYQCREPKGKVEPSLGIAETLFHKRALSTPEPFPFIARVAPRRRSQHYRVRFSSYGDPT